ncbi:MAG: ABC transporter substrate-binding protein [Betaproteobacteria bacterium]|nr:ABC transporter substrate-binding protein [Betaproteobacteria bacterium]
MTRAARILLLLALAAWHGAASSLVLVETPMLAGEVASGKLPPVGARVPEPPLVVRLEGKSAAPGKHGGTLQMLIGRSRDVRMLVVYGYARLVGYDRALQIVPDILESIDVRDARVFTMKLRHGHKWSDGAPFTTEDFRYYWEDVANNKELSPAGPPRDLVVEGEPPKVEILDRTTVRYSWSKPNPDFLPRMAGASPLFIFRPAHYLRQFHKRYNPKLAQAEASGKSKRRWSQVHNREDNMYQFDNPGLPTLQPWMNTTKPPADRFVAVRNPYFHRVDANGRQLPYIDRVVMAVAEGKLIPAKTGAGESDLQARDLQFNNYTFLKKGERRNNYRTLLWRTAKGSQFALFPNLNVNDPVWRKVLRDVRFRRALSLAIDRSLINQVLYFGLAIEGNNTVLAQSPLYRKYYQTRWALYDRKVAARLLDQMGLKRGLDGARRLPDGRPLEIVVETAGETTEQTDVLELIRETWREVGIKLFSKPSQREVLRNRVFSGEAMMSVWSGLDNGIPTPDMNPDELAPTSQQQLQWPKFGQHFETRGKAGEAPDIAEAAELLELRRAWRTSVSSSERAAVWQRMLEIHAEQQFVIGVVCGVLQPVVVRASLRNVPEKGLYNWDPGAFFGIYRPETFWISEPARN